MSLLGDFLGSTATALAENIDRTTENKRLLAERLRQEKREERLTRERRAADRKDEERKLGREVKEQYPDLNTNEMVTIYQNGREERRPLRPSELKEMKERDERTGLVNEQMRAQIEAMRRGGSSGGSGGGRPVTVGSEGLLASMGFESKSDLYDSGDDQAITAYESMLGVKLAPDELEDLRGRLLNLGRNRRQAGVILDAEQEAADTGNQAPLYFYEGNARQITPSELARQAQLRKQQEERRLRER